MSAYSTQVQAMLDYLNSLTGQTNSATASATSQAARDPSSQLQASQTAAMSSATLSPLRSTPIAAMGQDTLNNFVTTTAQGLVSAAINLPGISSTVNQFFTSPYNVMMSAYATFSTLPVEIAMAMARNTAKNIITQLDLKDSLTTQLQQQLIALHNAVLIILNSEPFFNSYITKITLALQQLVLADGTSRVWSIVSTLRASSTLTSSIRPSANLTRRKTTFSLPPARM